MFRQVGDLVMDEHGLARRGLLVRHLVMPDEIAGTRDTMSWIAQELSLTTYVNVMPQYYPAGKVSRREYPDINRRISPTEYETALAEARRSGLKRLDSRRPSFLGIL
jgi:putative pyruvate formate lyase activating enzyme